MLSASKQLNGTVNSVKFGDIVTEVVVTVGILELVTHGSVDHFGVLIARN